MFQAIAIVVVIGAADARRQGLTRSATGLIMVKLNKIYTRTGDDGTTGLVDGSRIAKSDARMAAIGDVDEANSAIGVAVVALEPAAIGRRC